jgi:hypothetical protein
MTYSISTDRGMWMIYPGASGRWVLSRQKVLNWRAVGLFNSAADAADAVATRKTGDPEWDLSPHAGELNLSRWKVRDAKSERMAGK